MKITRTAIRNLPPPGNQRRFFHDDETKGLSICQHPSGKVTFHFHNFLNGRHIKKKLGDHPDLSPEEARKIVIHIKAHGALGRDILAEAKAKQEAPAEKTFAEIIEEFRKLHIARKRPTSAAEDERKLKGRLIPKYGKKKIGEITHSDILKLHSEMKEHPVEANRTLALLSSIFNFSIKIGARTDNPAKGVKKYDENPRERYLSKDERETFAAALATANEKADTLNAIRFLAETGARRNEMLMATWGQFDLKIGVWTKPASNTKQRKTHVIPLSDSAFEILKTQAKTAGKINSADYVFSPELSRDGLKTSLKRVFSRICKAAGVIGFRVHDLRHTFASTLVMSGSNLPLVGKLLGHNNQATTARYAHLADDSLREALKRRDAIK